jgi:hypothetical protein
VWVTASSPNTTWAFVSRIGPRFDAIARTARVGNVVPGFGTVAAADGNTLSLDGAVRG